MTKEHDDLGQPQKALISSTKSVVIESIFSCNN